MELSDNQRKIYREYIIRNEKRIFFTFSFFKVLVEKKINLNQFTNECLFLFDNEYFLNKYLEGDISENEVSILRNEFSINTHIDLYKNYFSSINEDISESNGVKTVELTAYGTSKTQNRKIIAFRGIFKNGLLVSYESKVNNCETDSIAKKDLLLSKYVLNDQEFLVELIKHDFNDILDPNSVNVIMLKWFDSINQKFDAIKKFLDNNHKFIGEDYELGLLFNEFNLTRFTLDSDPSVYWFKKDDLKRYEIVYSSSSEKTGYLVNDFLDLFYNFLVENGLHSENVKKLSPSMYSMMTFQAEKDILEGIKTLKLNSITKAKEIRSQIDSALELEKKKKKKIYITIAVIFILFVLASILESFLS
jgi:hypothetical protein